MEGLGGAEPSTGNPLEQKVGVYLICAVMGWMPVASGPFGRCQGNPSSITELECFDGQGQHLFLLGGSVMASSWVSDRDGSLSSL